MSQRDHTSMPSDDAYHIPVMLKQAVEALSIKPDGVYVDCTFGGGGHSREILSRLGPDGRLIVFDQDPASKANLPKDARIEFVEHNFRHLTRFLRLMHINQVDGLLADLGVSSRQFDDATRGFSIRFEGPLDMRMDPSHTKTAATILQQYAQEELHRIFERYGEVTNAKSLAAAIVKRRVHTPVQTILQFKQTFHDMAKGNPHKYWAQVFQALRIEVNDELQALEDLLTQLPDLMKPGGRIAIISFHSLEDRIVKKFFKEELHPEDDHPFSRETRHRMFKVITKKPIEPDPAEIKSNPRSRSARLRVAEKL